MRTPDRLLPELPSPLLPFHNSPMGNHRFRVSDMMPSSWFFKLKDATRYTAMKRTHHHHHHHHHQPQSTLPLPLPRRSSCYISTRERTEGFPHSPVNHKASDTQFPLSSPRKLLPLTPPPPPAKPVSDDLSHLNLPPILTKPAKAAAAAAAGETETGSRRSPPRSPRFAAAGKQRSKALAESLVVVKSSLDPRRDFRDSMVEMIVVNDIRTARDLEELLMCYLSLNSRRYHGIILREFKQIWFEFVTH